MVYIIHIKIWFLEDSYFRSKIDFHPLLSYMHFFPESSKLYFNKYEYIMNTY